MRTMAEELENQGFDLVVTHRDPETGAVVRQNPYTLRVCGEGRKRLWERPKNSGNLFDKKGEPCGRWVNGKHDPLAEHVEVAPELSSEQRAAQVLHEKDERILALEKELASVRAEAKQAGKPKATAKADKV